jgi:chemotaxis protein MotB
MSAKPPATLVIVRRKTKTAHAHHGGAWKVAYADFVTALMSFFLVMWLVSQSHEVRASVANYFRDPGVFEYQRSTGMLPGGRPGAEPGGLRPAAAAAVPAFEQDLLARAAEHIRQRLSEAESLAKLRDQIEYRVTAEGLRIELVERADSPFFDRGSAELLGEAERILQIIGAELSRLDNQVVVEGHTDRAQYTPGSRYGNWELSADRANAARRVMERAGVNDGRIRGVRGFADTELHVRSDPFDARNRRVSIVVRTHAAAAPGAATDRREDD